MIVHSGLDCLHLRFQTPSKFHCKAEIKIKNRFHWEAVHQLLECELTDTRPLAFSNRRYNFEIFPVFDGISTETLLLNVDIINKST